MRAVAVALIPALLLAGCLAGTGGQPTPSATDDNGTDGPLVNATKPPTRTPPPGDVVQDPACAFVDVGCPAPCAPATGIVAACAPPARVTVAVIDSGINPYHADFAGFARAPDGATPLLLSLRAPFADAVKADEATWKSVEVGKLYTIPGTRIAGAITMGDLGTSLAPSASLILDDVGHGTGTASAVVRNSPHADIVMVQVGAGSLAKGIQWAAEQEWIDIISISWGTIANAPVGGGDVADAARFAADAGKLVLVAAGNEPTLAPVGYSGPTWVISVGGSSPDGKGETWTASKGVDVVSDFSPVLARHDSDEATDEMYGTSFATPSVAGALAEAWWIARDAALDTDAQKLRAAMNAVALYFAPTDYKPSTQELPVLAPCAQQGWGYVDGTLAMEIALVATAQKPAPAKAEADICMQVVYAARSAWWG